LLVSTSGLTRRDYDGLDAMPPANVQPLVDGAPEPSPDANVDAPNELTPSTNAAGGEPVYVQRAEGSSTVTTTVVTTQLSCVD
jgi:hypothetical protein